MRATVLLLAAVLWCSSIFAAVPHQINYQGYLTATGGTPVNATVAMVLNLYNVDTGGATLYTETQTVTVTNGVFNVVIGSVTPLPLPFDVPYWLGVKVGTDAEMAPRQPVAASAYAIRSATTEALAVTATVPGSQITGAVSSAANFTGALAGDVTGTQGATAIAAATVTGKALTGFASAAGTITAADTVLTAVNKLNGNVALRAPLASPTFTGTVNATGDVNMTGSLRKSGSLFLHNLGTGNIALGISALPVTSTGQFNNAVGNGALAQNSSGVQNNALGGDALGANSTGSANTAVGDQALKNNVGGSNNVAVGDNALLNATGTGNIGIGAGAGENLTTGGGNIAIGNSGVAGESGTIRIGDSATQTRTMLAGTVGIGTASPLTDTKLHVVSNSPKATIATTRALAVTTNDASNPFALDVKMVGAAAQTDRGVILQTADWNSSDGGNILLQPQGGNVGIGTTTPIKAKLEISGFSSFNMGTFGGLFNTGAAVAPQPAQAMNVSVYANANIAASVFVAFSDERIKHVAGRSDAARDLATLAAIEVTDYSYIDTATKGTGKHKKVVAQQVEKVYPQAVSRSTDVVPDI